MIHLPQPSLSTSLLSTAEEHSPEIISTPPSGTLLCLATSFVRAGVSVADQTNVIKRQSGRCGRPTGAIDAMPMGKALLSSVRLGIRFSRSFFSILWCLLYPKQTLSTHVIFPSVSAPVVRGLRPDLSHNAPNHPQLPAAHVFSSRSHPNRLTVQIYIYNHSSAGFDPVTLQLLATLLPSCPLLTYSAVGLIQTDLQCRYIYIIIVLWVLTL